jgi:prevent-host-death family protein
VLSRYIATRRVSTPYAADSSRAVVAHVLQLCVMSDGPRRTQRVGIRELRQNLSVYVKRVREEGRAYEVTERGEPVARLTPLTERPASRIEQMIAEGRITPATRRWEDIPPPVPMPPGTPLLSEILQRMRDEDPR